MTATEPAPAPKKQRNRWIWVSAGLGLLAAGFLVWALMLRSDLDSAKQDNKALQAQIDDAKSKGTTAADEAKAIYDEITQQLGATSEDLANTQSELDKAKKAAAAATAAAAAAAAAAVKAGNNADAADQQSQDAQKQIDEASAEAEKASEATEKAQAETKKANAEADQARAERDKATAEADQAKAERDKATAEAQLAQSRASILADCAKAYVSAAGTLFAGESVKDQAPAVRKQLDAITGDCKAALAAA